MARIVFNWELGAHLGHVARFVPLATALREAGHETDFILRDLASARSLLGNLGRIWQAPVCSPRRGPARRPPLTYPEILHRVGYRSAAELRGLVDGWRNLFELIGPDLLVCDFAPTALLAARGLSCRRAIIGSGFFTPPPVNPIPSFLSEHAAAPARLERVEQSVLTAANRVLEQMGEAPLSTLSELFEVDEHFLCTLPELDPYTRPAHAYWGPFTAKPLGVPPAWADNGAPKVFAYLKGQYRGFDALLRLLTDVDYDALIFAPDAPGRTRMANPAVLSQPCRLDAVAASCTLAVGHAGHDTTAELLLSGCPQLLIPLYVEQQLLARSVARIGAALVVEPEDGPRKIEEKLERLVREPQFASAARKFALGHVTEADGKTRLQRIAGRCAELADQRAGGSRGTVPTLVVKEC